MIYILNHYFYIIWLHLTTFQKSGAKDLAQPFIKVDSKDEF